MERHVLSDGTPDLPLIDEKPFYHDRAYSTSLYSGCGMHCSYFFRVFFFSSFYVDLFILNLMYLQIASLISLAKRSIGLIARTLNMLLPFLPQKNDLSILDA